MGRTRTQSAKGIEKAETSLNYYQMFYSELAEQWKNETDDRKLFSNNYFIILEMYEDYTFCKSPSTRVAINEKAKEYEEQMKSIRKHFTGK